MEYVIEIALNIFYGALILAVAFYGSGWARNRILVVSERYEKIDRTLFGFLGNVVRYSVLVLAVLFVLNRFGIETTSLIAMIGAAGLAIGLALQGTLSNFAAGVMLVIFRPVKVGDYVVIGGDSGTVREVTLFTTELSTPDNAQVIVPNGKIWASSITNHSFYDTRRVSLTFGVAYGSDLKKVEAVMRAAIEADERVHGEPEPYVRVATLGESSIDFVLRVWCDSD